MKLLVIIIYLTGVALTLKAMESPDAPLLRLPTELRIESLKLIINASPNQQEAIKSILAIGNTNRTLYSFINRLDVTTSLLKGLVTRFTAQGIASELEAALSLRTVGAVKWIQEKLKEDQAKPAKEFTHMLHEAFLTALSRQNKNRAQWMLDTKLIDVNTYYERGDAPVRPVVKSVPLLIKAVRFGKHAVEFLLNRGAHSNASSNRAWTALMEAVRANKPDVVQLLIDRQVNLNRKSELDQTALDIAIILSRPVVEDILRKAGAKRSSELR